MKRASIVATICFLGALGAIALVMDTAYARGPDCPSSWPQETSEQFFTDSDGAEWFVIRSADSNGYETVRAYRADDGYQTGYVPGSPDEVCYLLVRRPRDAEDLAEAQQLEFRVEQEEEPVPAVSKTLFREFYDRLIPVGPYGPNPDPKWGDLFVVFSAEERSCIAAALGEEGLAAASQSSVFHEGDEPRLQDVFIFGCLADDTSGALTFAIAFAAIVRQVDASGEENTCVQELLEPAVAALSKPSPTEDDVLAVFALFFGLISCGLEVAPTGTAPPAE
ncbi:MAG: hypothetical protein OXL37_15400 [Chloroflexota bacterium]|nr:hypothetical protein [Rhodospirillaceae bacterium]MDE2788031.1 hypothetical protein [Chloroflexota bacterium]MDE2961901.1 hypothetical protein [Chloroflexota bacterium]